MYSSARIHTKAPTLRTELSAVPHGGIIFESVMFTLIADGLCAEAGVDDSHARSGSPPCHVSSISDSKHFSIFLSRPCPMRRRTASRVDFPSSLDYQLSSSLRETIHLVTHRACYSWSVIEITRTPNSSFVFSFLRISSRIMKLVMVSTSVRHYLQLQHISG